MSEWKSWAKHGFWDRVDAEAIFALGDESEITELRNILEKVVPTIRMPQGKGGPLGHDRRATITEEKLDERELISFVEDGRYASAMRRVHNDLDAAPDPQNSVPLDVLLATESKRAGGRHAAELRQLRHATAALDLLTADIDISWPGLRWIGDAENAAIEQLLEHSINYLGLDDTYVELRDVDTGSGGKAKKPTEIPRRWVQVEKHTLKKSLTLRQVQSENDVKIRSHVWHAVNVLSACEELRIVFSLLPPESTNSQKWKPSDVLGQMTQAVGFAKSIGQHLTAMDLKYLEPLAQVRAGQTESLKVASQESEKKMRPDKDKILGKMQEYIDTGKSVRCAGQIVYKKDRLGSTAEANRQLYARQKIKK
jgi:hypothetical protein